jgi:hypothetical protein
MLCYSQVMLGYMLPFILYTYMLQCFTHTYVMLRVQTRTHKQDVSVRAAPVVAGSTSA